MARKPHSIPVMKEFDFTLKFGLPGATIDAEALVERLAMQGCDDALIGIGQTGRLALNFTRQADSAFEAISSAVVDVKCAMPDAELIEASPDLVGLTDVADIVGCSRQYMRKLMITSGATFPAPVHEGKSALWHLCGLLVWLMESNRYQVEDTLMDIARTTMQFNMAREADELDPVMQTAIANILNAGKLPVSDEELADLRESGRR